MSDLQAILDAIDRTLATCDASTLPPLHRAPAEPITLTAPSAEEFADGLSALAAIGQSVGYLAPPPPEQQPAADPTRGWLPRWIRRNRR